MAFINPWTMIKPIFGVIKNHGMNGIHVIHKGKTTFALPIGSVQLSPKFCKQTNSTSWKYCIHIISDHCWLCNHATQIWLLEVLCSARCTGQGWAIFIVKYRESNILHHLEILHLKQYSKISWYFNDICNVWFWPFLA